MVPVLRKLAGVRRPLNGQYVMRRESKVSNLKMRHHSLSRKVSFTDANDHNPVVLDECPRCHGSGKASEYGPGVHYQVECDACSGTGTTGQRVRYFDNDAPIAEVNVESDGWLTCPCCGWRFSLNDRNVWSGLRHVRCGQRIRPVGSDA